MKFLVYDNCMDSLRLAFEIVATDPSLDCKFILDNPKAAEDYVQSVSIAIAMLGTQDKEHDLIPLAKTLRSIDPDLPLGFLVRDSSYEKEIREAFPSGLVGIRHAPFGKEDFLNCLKLAKTKKQKDVFFRTYWFDMVVDGEVITFNSTKAKELLALLVAHWGGTLEMKEAISRLWPGKDWDLAKRLYRDAVCRLRGLLRSLDLADMVEWGRGRLRLPVENARCLYYDKKKNKEPVDSKFFQSYPWAKDFWREGKKH